MTIKFTCRTTLLEAMARFAYARNDGTREHLAQVRITKDDLCATNGHRLALVPVRSDNRDAILVGTIDEPCLIPTELIRHHVAGARSNWEEYVESEYIGHGPWTYTKNSFHRAISTVEVESLADPVRTLVKLTVDGITTSGTSHCTVDEYPKVDALMSTMHAEGAPALQRFDPKLFAHVEHLLKASDDMPGLKMAAWDVMGTGVGPTVYSSYRGTKIILMGMANNESEAREARHLHAKAMRGEKPA